MKCIILYSSEHNDQYPYFGPANVQTKPAINATPGTFNGGCLMNDMYYLVGMGVVAPKQFVCKNDKWAVPAFLTTAVKGNPPYAPVYWNNGKTGPGGADLSYSYSFAFQYTADGKLGDWWRNTMDGELPIGADMAPLNGTGRPAATTGDGKSPNANSFNHEREGQNVVYADQHVDFMHTAAAGTGGDNIYAASKGKPSAVGVPCMGGLPDVGDGGKPGAWDVCLVPAADGKTGARK